MVGQERFVSRLAGFAPRAHANRIPNLRKIVVGLRVAARRLIGFVRMEVSMFRVRCECGEEVAVPAVKAGGAVACPCGRQVPVPSLSVLRSYAARGEAAPCSHSPQGQLKQASQPAAARLPETAIVHCCGSVKSTGNVSPVAIQNYVGVLLQGIERFVSANPQALDSELVLSCALLPAARPWLDIEAFPPAVESTWLNELTELLLQTPAPPVMGQPVGFAIYRRLHSRPPLLNDFTPFRNLGGAITARELQTGRLRLVRQPLTRGLNKRWST